MKNQKITFRKLVVCIFFLGSVNMAQAQETSAMNAVRAAAELASTVGDFSMLGVRTALLIEQINYSVRRFEDLKKRQAELEALMGSDSYQSYVSTYGENGHVLNQVKNTAFLIASVAYLTSDVLSFSSGIMTAVTKEGTLRGIELNALVSSSIKATATEALAKIPVVGPKDSDGIIGAVSLMRSNAGVVALKTKVSNMVDRVETLNSKLDNLHLKLERSYTIISSCVGVGNSFLALQPCTYSHGSFTPYSDAAYQQRSYDRKMIQLEKIRASKAKIFENRTVYRVNLKE